MSDYQSISDIISANRQNPDLINPHSQAVIDRFSADKTCASLVRHIDPAFSAKQADDLKILSPNLPLFGVSLAHKELFGRAGWGFEGGSLSYKGQIATKTATVISKLDRAGAIDCGRLVTVEYALGVTGHNDYAGTPQNPWHQEYICGGSSSGSAAMVARGIIPASLGTDTGGSVRLPAAACGLVGIKPSSGLVSRNGVFPLSPSLDTVGVLSRSVRDSAIMLSVIAGYDPLDSLSLDGGEQNYHQHIEGGIADLKIGLAVHYFLDQTDSFIADYIADCFDLISSLGANCTDITIKDIEITNPLNVLLTATEAAHIHGETILDRPEALNPQTLMRILAGLYSSDEDYQKLLDCRADSIARHLPDIFDKVDIFITPVWPFELPTINASDIGSNPKAADLVQRIGHNTRPINFLGLPAICLPIGLDSHGLPIAVQLVGKPFSEAMLMRAARAIEREYRFWENHRPNPAYS